MNNKVKKYIDLYKSMFGKRDKNLWIFGSWFGDKFADNSKYLFLEASKLENIRSVWVSRNIQIVNELRQKKYEAYIVDSEEAICLQKKAKFFFVSTGVEDCYFSAIGNAVVINLWHGVPLKKIMYDDKIAFNKKSLFERGYVGGVLRKIPLRNTFITSTSTTVQQIYLSCFRKGVKHVPILGQPRNDMFFDKTLGEDLHTKLANEKKIILYMPTHRNSGYSKIECNKVFEMKKLDAFCKKNNYVFLIKKHYYHSNEVEELEDYETISDVTQQNFDSQEILSSADILITDYSSCYIDYLLINRPIIFYDYDLQDYLINDREMYFNYDDVTPGYKAGDFMQLMEYLSVIIEQGIDIYADERKRVCNVFYDKSCQNIVGTKIIDFVLGFDK